MKFSIVIPCYNESENLQYLVQSIMPLTEQYDLEYVLVENGSKDDSRKKFETLPELQHPSIVKVYVDENKGYGYGVQQGLKACTGDYIGWIHADLQLRPTELIPLFEYAKQQGEGALLFLKGKRSNRSLFDTFFTAGMSVFETMLFRTRLYDIGAIPTLFSRQLLDCCDKLPYDFAIELYVYLQAKRNGYSVKRFDVQLENRKRGKSSWNKGLKSKIFWSKRIIRDSFKIKRGQQVM